MITKVELKDVPPARYEKRKVVPQIREFMESNWDACEVDTSEYKSVQSAYSAFYNAVKRHNYPIAVRQRGNRIYLVKEEQK